MSNRKTKFAIFAFGIVASMALLIYAAIGQESGLTYYVTVGEYLKSPPEGAGFRVNGQVKAGSISRQTSGMDVEFTITDGSADMPVRYHGIIPDTFVDGVDVVVEGSLAGDGTFVANNMLAKCPSKYEAAAEAQGTQPAYGTKSY